MDDYLRKNYPGREAEMFEKLSKSQPMGRMAEPGEVASLALFLCSDEAPSLLAWIIRLDGGFFNFTADRWTAHRMDLESKAR